MQISLTWENSGYLLFSHIHHFDDIQRMRFAFSSIILILHLSLSAQPDTAFVATAKKNVRDLYSKSTLHTSKLLNGTAYKELMVTNDSHPYYMSDDWQKSDVMYEGDRFLNMDLMYDLFSDNIVFEHANGSKLQAIKQNVQSFSIGSARFINIVASDSLLGLPEVGFYQQVYTGKTECVTRWTKLVDREAVDGRLELNYREKIAHYVKKGEAYIQVKSRASLLKLLSDRKKEVKKFIKENQIRWKDNQQNALRKVLTFYDNV
jgi:hypothetical protein